jgi:hypothetical protein
MTMVFLIVASLEGVDRAKTDPEERAVFPSLDDR